MSLFAGAVVKAAAVLGLYAIFINYAVSYLLVLILYQLIPKLISCIPSSVGSVFKYTSPEGIKFKVLSFIDVPPIVTGLHVDVIVIVPLLPETVVFPEPLKFKLPVLVAVPRS